MVNVIGIVLAVVAFILLMFIPLIYKKYKNAKK